MDDLKWKSALIIFLILFLPSFVFTIYAFNSSGSYIQIIGFGVDSSGKIYVGNEENILVYNNEKMEKIIYPMTNRGYNFTIQHDDTILLSTSTEVYILDLQGQEISEQEDIDGLVSIDLHSETASFTASDGTEYRIKNRLGRYKIIKEVDGEEVVVNRMPLYNFIVKLVTYFTVIGAFSFVPAFLIRNYKSKFLSNTIFKKW